MYGISDEMNMNLTAMRWAYQSYQGFDRQRRRWNALWLFNG